MMCQDFNGDKKLADYNLKQGKQYNCVPPSSSGAAEYLFETFFTRPHIIICIILISPMIDPR